MIKILLFVMASSFSIFACTSNETVDVIYYKWHNKWFKKTKKEILTKIENLDGNIETKDTLISNNFKKRFEFKNNRKTTLKHFNNEKMVLRIYYYNDFELRQEFCKNNGVMQFEGVFYKNKGYGLAKSWHCNGKIKSSGLRFDGKKIAKWNEWDTLGNISEVIIYPNVEPLSENMLEHYSMPVLN